MVEEYTQLKKALRMSKIITKSQGVVMTESREQVKSYAKIVIKLIDNEPRDDIGFIVEEIYNQALTDQGESKQC